MSGLAKALPWLPVAVVAAGVIGTAAVDSWRLSAQASEIGDIVDDVKENEDTIELIQRRLIERQGEVELRTQRIEIEQRAQSEDLEQILRLLRQIQRGGGDFAD